MKDGTDVLADYRYVGPFIDQLEYLNGVVRSTTFDAAGRPTVVDHDDSGTTIAKFTTIYDDNGNVTSVRRAHESNLYDVFEYDKRDQRVVHYDDATSSSSPSVYLTKEELTLDAARNIDSRAVTPYGLFTATTDYDVDSRNDYDTIGLQSPTWTENGELDDDDAGTTYVWNWRGEMVSATTGGNTYTFEHDALGRRITTDFGTELRYTWAGERIVEECDVAMSPTVQATWVWGMDPEPIRMDRGGTVSFYHADAEGSVEKLTSSAAAVQESVEYGPWGAPSIASSGQGNLFLWKGELYDFEMELYDALGGTYDGAVMLRVLDAAQSAALVVDPPLGPGSSPQPFCLTCPDEDIDDLPIDGGGVAPPPCFCFGTYVPNPWNKPCSQVCAGHPRPNPVNPVNPPPPPSLGDTGDPCSSGADCKSGYCSRGVCG